MGITVNLEVEVGYTSVDIDLGDIDTELLMDELRERKFGLPESSNDDVVEMFYAFKLGRTDRAMELAKKIASDHTGMIL